MTDSYRAELLEQADRVFRNDLGGRGSLGDVLDRLVELLPPGAESYYVRKGVANVVAAYFRQQTRDGLPQAPQVNDTGEHAQLELLTVVELTYLARQYLDRSQANRVQAEKVAARCAEMYGVALDLDALAEAIA